MIFKRILEFRGKGNKFIINSIFNLFISNEFSHNISLNTIFLNFNLKKYNNIIFFFNNFFFNELIYIVFRKFKKKRFI